MFRHRLCWPPPRQYRVDSDNRETAGHAHAKRRCTYVPALVRQDATRTAEGPPRRATVAATAPVRPAEDDGSPQCECTASPPAGEAIRQIASGNSSDVERCTHQGPAATRVRA